MTKRLDKLRRIAAVQQKMVRHAELQHALADKTCRDLVDDRTRLQGYMYEQGGLGDALARTALRSIHRIEDRLEDARIHRDLAQQVLSRAKRREHVAGEIEQRVAKVETRATEDAELARLIEAWLIGKDTSLR